MELIKYGCAQKTKIWRPPENQPIICRFRRIPKCPLSFMKLKKSIGYQHLGNSLLKKILIHPCNLLKPTKETYNKLLEVLKFEMSKKSPIASSTNRKS